MPVFCQLAHRVPERGQRYSCLHLDDAAAGIRSDEHEIPISVEGGVRVVVKEYVYLTRRADVADYKTSTDCDGFGCRSANHVPQYRFLPFTICGPMLIFDEHSHTILQRHALRR